MRHVRLAALVAALLAFAGVTLAGASSAGTTTPQSLRAFLLRADEPLSHTFPRTPAFAWSPVRGARCYEFELATSKTFVQNSLVWSNVQYTVGRHKVCGTVSTDTPAGDATGSAGSTSSSSGSTGSSTPSTPASTDPATSTTIAPLRVPAAAVDLALPWFTGAPYALYAHVRAITRSGPSAWSRPFGFNMQWESIPRPLPSQPGLIQWTPVEGATGYQVWYIEAGHTFSTHTNVADEREYYTFHTDPSFTGTVHWRVRAIRRIFGSIPNGLPAVSYGAWSPIYTATNPAFDAGPLALKRAVSDGVVSDARKQASHDLMPGLVFTGSTVGGRQYALFRAYAFTDRDCVNVVFRGPIVGSPAYAPRSSGPLKLPGSDTDLQTALTSYLPFANDESAATFAADGSKVTTSEAVTSSASDGTTGVDATINVAGAKVDLPDLNFPTTRYYWTIVPVVITEDESGSLKYYDAEVPQDACAAGREQSFGKGSEPVVATAGTPFVAGLSPQGRMLASVSRTPVVYGTPLVAWQPATGASAYEIQWSRKQYPWNAAGSKITYSTSALLNLKPGKWYYRVRGLNLLALQIPYMTWSTPVQITVAKPTFTLVTR